MEKKILIVGLTFNEALGTGVTIRQLFSQIQPCWIGIVDYSVRYKDFKYANSLFSIRSDAQLNENVENNKSIFDTKKKRIGKIKVDIFKFAFLRFRKYLVYYYNNYYLFKITPNLKKFIADFEPDFIYVVPYNRRIIDLTLKINDLFNIPIITHFMDDFKNRSPHDILYYLNEYLSERKIKKIVHKSNKCLAICEFMSEEYQRIFNCDFHSFHNPIETGTFQKYSVLPSKSSLKELKIVYTGTIAENNYDTLILFAKTCEGISYGSINIVFDIYSPHNASNIFYQRLVKSIQGYKCTILKRGIPHSEIIPKLFEYNLLLLPLTFRTEYINVIEFSFPTKVAEYMASGIPTLHIIPNKIALHAFIKQNEIGYLIDKPDSKQIEDFLLSYMNEASMRIEDTKAKKFSYENFNKQVIALKFKNLFA